jgi:hypothetical protein
MRPQLFWIVEFVLSLGAPRRQRNKTFVLKRAFENVLTLFRLYSLLSHLFIAAATCLAACPLFLAQPAIGAEPLLPVESIDSEYLVETWQTERGLPDNFVNAIAQTPDGYLWVGTFNGLARFNGVEFVVFDSANTPELPTSRIVSLHCDRKGRLWIISEYGDLTQWAEGRFKDFGEREGLPKHAGGVVWEDQEGGIWSSSGYNDTNYFQFVDGAFTPAHATNTLYLRFGRTADAQGYGWGVRSNHLFSVHWQNDARIPEFTPSEAWRLTAASDGGMWLIASRIQKFHPPERVEPSAPHLEPEGHFEDFGPIPVSTDQFMQYLGDRAEICGWGLASANCGGSAPTTPFADSNFQTAQLWNSAAVSSRMPRAIFG